MKRTINNCSDSSLPLLACSHVIGLAPAPSWDYQIGQKNTPALAPLVRASMPSAGGICTTCSALPLMGEPHLPPIKKPERLPRSSMLLPTVQQLAACAATACKPTPVQPSSTMTGQVGLGWRPTDSAITARALVAHQSRGEGTRCRRWQRRGHKQLPLPAAGATERRCGLVPPC